MVFPAPKVRASRVTVVSTHSSSRGWDLSTAFSAGTPWTVLNRGDIGLDALAPCRLNRSGTLRRRPFGRQYGVGHMGDKNVNRMA